MPGGDGGPRRPAEAASAGHVFVAALADVVEPDGADAHHLARVLRVRDGEVVTAADGAGRWRCYRARPRPDGLVLEADGPTRAEPAVPTALAVAFGLTKGSKPEVVVARLTELGVDRIVPVVTRRSVVRWDDAKRDAAASRLGRVAREAAVQSRRATLPVVEPVCPLGDLSGHPCTVVGVPGAPPLLAAAAAAGWPGDPPVAEVLGVVGPEGGFDPGEVATLGEVVAVGLGPAVLRAETAAVALCAVLTALRTFWYEE